MPHYEREVLPDLMLAVCDRLCVTEGDGSHGTRFESDRTVLLRHGPHVGALAQREFEALSTLTKPITGRAGSCPCCARACTARQSPFGRSRNSPNLQAKRVILC